MTANRIQPTWPVADPRELRVFLVLAEELHFTRRAERLGINHSRVSQIIRTLEARVGACSTAPAGAYG
jgi:DNA-binding CsgD family transcriptional regulator